MASELAIGKPLGGFQSILKSVQNKVHQGHK
jgi:hypothetical protein